MANVVDQKVKELLEFFDDCVKFFNKCEKPNKKEYLQITKSCAIGFLIMGIIGYIIKLLFIPINTILLSK
jgi:protein transport protein SEC61 subunit gamma-like protein